MAGRELIVPIIGRRAAHRVSLTDGSIKAELVKRARVVTNSTALKVLPRGSWLEIAKNDDGEGVLRVRNAERNKVLFALPVHRVDRLKCPSKNSWGSGFRLSILRHRVLSRRRGIFEVEGTNDGHKVHAAFVVRDPDGWIAAMSAPEWSN